MAKKILAVLMVLIIVPVLFAGTAGKIAGVVKDKQTGEPLPGVNVLVEGTTLGASTDIDGYYVIVNAPVGTHELRITYIGYKEILIYNVRVVADATTRYDFDMEQTLLEVSEVIEVIAERELIARDNTASRAVISSEVIDSQPVDNITRSVALTAGITENSFRGGRRGTGEVKYLVDGVDVSSPLAATHTSVDPGQGSAELATDLPEASMEEVQVITGGMGAQYDARSAVVSIVTKSGGSEYSGFVRTKQSPSEYGFSEDIGQVEGFKTDAQALDIARGIKRSKSAVTNFLTQPEKTFVNPKFQRYEFGFGGPIPIKNLGVGGSLTFNLNGDIFDRGGFYRKESTNSESYTGKLVYNTASNSSYSLSYLNSTSEQRNYSHSWNSIVSTGDVLYGYSAGGGIDSVLVGSIVDAAGNLHAVKNYDMLDNITRPEFNSDLLSFSYKNTVSSKTFYEIKVSRFNTEQKRRNYDPATGKPLGLEDFRQRRFADPTNPIYFPAGATYSLRLETYWEVQPMSVARSRQDDKQVVWTYRADLVSQLNEFNELRVGTEFKQYNLHLDYQSFASGGNEYTSVFDVSPLKFSAYVSDKIETEGMIINAGLRFDYYDPNAIVPENFADPLINAAKDPESDIYLDPTTPVEDRIKNPTSSNITYRVTPRIGISFPITELDVFHINYGHYFGLPGMGEMFNNYSWSLLGAFKYIGNPNLKEEKIISYEAGIEHGFTDNVKLSVTGFYKDMADLTNFRKYEDAATGAPYWVKINSDYGNVKGFEVSVATRRWYNTIANVSYTYQIAKGKNSAEDQAFSDDYNNRRPRTDEFFLDWDVRHTVSANIDYRVPKNWMDSEWLGDWGGNLIVTYNSGRPYSSANTVPPPNQPPVNDERYPEWLNLDLRLFKNFPIYKQMQFGAFLEVYNLLNDRTLRSIDNVEQYDQGYDTGDGVRNRPDVWATPREMRLGFEVRF